MIQLLKKSNLGVLLTTLLLAGCSNDSKLVGHIPAGGGLQSISLTSSAFKGGQAIPKEFTADGQDISPPLKWISGPPQTQEFILFVEDPDAPGKEPFVQWIVYGLSPNQLYLPQGISSAMGGSGGSITQGANSKGLTSYAGPEPEPGKVHRYFFEIFAVGRATNLKPGATKAEVVAAMNGHTLTKGVLVGTYKR
jgi:hypothetical protein